MIFVSLYKLTPEPETVQVSFFANAPLVKGERAASRKRRRGDSLFIFRLEEKRNQKPENDRRGNSGGCCGKPTGENSEKTFVNNRGADSLCKAVAETGKGNGRSGAGEFDQRFVKTEGGKNNSANNKANQDPGGGKLCFIDKNLANGAKNSADYESFKVFHLKNAPFFGGKTDKMGNSGNGFALLNACGAHQSAR